ncbi:hypothetical protein BN873_470088 [Candidatus Competibacter denitrificans Run_A_D11]|uniref:Uncharacterized protein n=1 Tax=Candidatus Competibacter denitrificans Run_A_D11 TaxID=1400863 RepID=W6M602_9GAMM|nr:hypothetical protein [Candidatus Competibacter denitrificans]CDI03346.1 hypothetical protein BN873_470088 [Candidatus Competibacter denitrificans Run_A_D11]HRC68954.1 hypothetical protein [Candidatus Competibacter denitrificans]
MKKGGYHAAFFIRFRRSGDEVVRHTVAVETVDPLVRQMAHVGEVVRGEAKPSLG